MYDSRSDIDRGKKQLNAAKSMGARNDVFSMIKPINRILLYILIPSVALAIWNGNITAIEIKDYIVKMVCILILMFSALRMMYRDTIEIRIDLFQMLAMGYGLLMLVGFAYSNGCSINYKAVAPQLFGIVVFFLFIYHFREKDIHRLVAICFVTALVCAVYGLLQYFGYDFLNWNVETKDVVTSFFGNRNYFSLYIILMLPLGGYFALSSSNRIIGIISLLACLIILVSLLLSKSRGGIVGLIAVVFLATILYLYKSRFRSEAPGIPWKWLCCVVFLLIVCALVVPSDIRNNYSRLFVFQDYQGRISKYKAAAEVIGRRPVTGVGPGNFMIEYPNNERARVYMRNPNDVLNHVHSDFLEIWAEYGVFAAATYLAIFGVLMVKLVKGYLSSKNGKQEWLLLSIAFSITGYFLYSQFTVAGRYMSSVFFFWLVTGLGYISLTSQGDKAHTYKFQNKLKMRKYGCASLLILILAIASLSFITVTRHYLSDIYLKKAAMRVKKNQFDDSMAYINRAVDLYPSSIEAGYQRGFILFNTGQYGIAISDYRSVDTMAPQYINVNFNMASCFYRQRDWVNAIHSAETANRLYPKYPPPLLMLANCYYYLRQPEKAHYYINELMEKDPSNKSGGKLKRVLENILRQMNP